MTYLKYFAKPYFTKKFIAREFLIFLGVIFYMLIVVLLLENIIGEYLDYLAFSPSLIFYFDGNERRFEEYANMIFNTYLLFLPFLIMYFIRPFYFAIKWSIKTLKDK